MPAKYIPLRTRRCQAVLDNLAEALNALDAAQERVDAALLAAVAQRCGTPARELLGVSEPTFRRRIRAAKAARSKG